MRRLRAASVLPALIGQGTIDLLKLDRAMGPKVKVTRGAVRRAMWQAWWWPKGRFKHY
jgi:hypothetical protein